MELQATSEPSSDPHSDTSRPALSNSAPSLRFPKPQGNSNLANWVYSSTPDIMQPTMTPDSSSMEDSAYELINSTDGEVESQDGHMAESIGSLAASRPEDVHSLDGSEDSYASSEDEEDDTAEHSSSDVSIQYADASLQNPSSHIPNSSLQLGLSADSSTPLLRSIEFQETDEDGKDAITEEVSVKHTIHDFTEDEVASVAKNLGHVKIPQRMVATIRQTMSQDCLPTKEPLRVLYVGSPLAQKEIIYKLSSAIWASGTADAENVAFRDTEGIYTIVPISSFGSSKEPEIQLMETSSFQIKVEHCTLAEEVYQQGDVGSATGLRLTIDHEHIYQSLSRKDSAIQPRWTLPQVAIFFTTETDGREAEQTRHAAWKFTIRHGIPSIFISHAPAYERPLSGGAWYDYIGPHAVHLCVESRSAGGAELCQRFPIDLASFINIDARQMNRNLSYLIGLTDSTETGEQRREKSIASKVTNLEKTKTRKLRNRRGGPKRTWEFEPLEDDEIWILRLSFAILAAVFTLVFYPTFSVWVTGEAPGPLTAPLSTVSTPVAPIIHTTTSTKQEATSTSTVVVNVTTTKTVKVSQSESTTSSLASALSFAGFLSDTPSAQVVNPEPKKARCTVEVHSPTEFLIKLPTRIASSFLAKGAIKIIVRRGQAPVSWRRLSSIDEGLLVDLGSENAYGLLNVTITTTRRPRLNETFEIDFGMDFWSGVRAAGAHFLQAIGHKVDETAHLVEDTCRPVAAAGLELLREESAHVGQTISEAKSLAETIANRVKTSLKPAQVTQILQEATDHLVRPIEGVRRDLGLSVNRAQIASRLWWLRMRGKQTEHDEYEQKATQFLKSRYLNIQEFKQSHLSEKNEARRKRQEAMDGRKAAIESRGRWKKLLVG